LRGAKITIYFYKPRPFEKYSAIYRLIFKNKANRLAILGFYFAWLFELIIRMWL